MDSERKIIWAPSALDDLKEIFNFIALDHPSRAQNLIERVVASVEKLARFSQAGRVIPEIGKSRYRELIIGEYRIFHEVREKEIFIFRVFHAHRLFSSE